MQGCTGDPQGGRLWGQRRGSQSGQLGEGQGLGWGQSGRGGDGNSQVGGVGAIREQEKIHCIKD